MKRFLVVLMFLAAGFSLFAAKDTRVNVLDYKSLVKNIGTPDEDWQPAIQKAVDDAFKGTRVVYFPAGKYPINRAVDIWQKKVRAFIGNALTLTGDGRFASFIIQKNKAENCVNWTGKTYKESLNTGTIEKLCLTGGKITLNIKWHNQFTMRSCYIAGASDTGIYNEGWSNRFLDILVRHCPKIGFTGRSHFNDITIRDGYFSRCGIGINMPGGVHGVRVSGVGFEHCSTTAIYMRNTFGVSINNCYFEGDGFSMNKKVLGSSITLSDRNVSFKVTGCIFRATDARSGQIIVATNNDNGRISDNIFQIRSTEAAIFFVKPEPRWKHYKNGRIVIDGLSLRWTYSTPKAMKSQIPLKYREETAGMIKTIKDNGGEIEKGLSVVGSSGKFTSKHDQKAFD